MKDVPPGSALRHHLEHTQQCRRLPVPLAGEPVTVRHQALDGDAGQLAQAAEVLEVRGERGEAAVVEEGPQAQFLAGGVAQRLAPIPARSQLGDHLVAVVVLLGERVDLGVRHGVHDGDEIVDAPGVHREAEDALGLDLVPLGHGDVPHDAADPGHPQRPGGVPPRGRASPRLDPCGDDRVAHVPGHDLAGHAEAGLDVAELAVAVRRLVEVHEVHVDLRPRQRHVGLRVQMEQGFAQRLQAADPHLRGREGVHPGDHADAFVGRGGVEAGAPDGVGRGQHGPPDQADAERRAERLRDLARLVLDLAQRLLPVQRLAAGEEPDLDAVVRCARSCAGLPHSGDTSSACWP